MPDDYNGTPVPEDHNPETGKDDQNENIPDWMKEAGWEPSSGTFDESKPVFDDLEDDQEDLVPADIPAWLEEAAPEGFDFESEPENGESGDSKMADPEPFAPDELDFGEAEVSSQPEPDTQAAGEEPAPAEDQQEIDIPSWLENLELDEDSQETAVAWLENMPESLRATEEELQAAEELATHEPERLEEPVDELAWLDDIEPEPEPIPDTPEEKEKEEDQAELSEDLVASELVPETSEPDRLFATEELNSVGADVPSWLDELDSDEPDQEVGEIPEETLTTAEDQGAPEPKPGDNMLPDWLSELEQEAEQTMEAPAPETTVEPETPAAEITDDTPDWLGEIESDDTEQPEEESESLQWLESLSGESEPSAADVEPASADYQEPEESLAAPEPVSPAESSLPPSSTEPAAAEAQEESVSPDDDTLSTQIPDWLAMIGDEEQETSQTPEASDITDESPPEPESTAEKEIESDFEDSASWLDQIGEEALDEQESAAEETDREVLDWLDTMGVQEPPQEAPPLDDIRESLTEEDAQQPPLEDQLETAKYFVDEETPPDDAQAAEETSLPEDDEDLPDWLSELRDDEEDESLTLEEAIRKSDHDLSADEQDFLSTSEEVKEANEDWLSKLDELPEEPLPESSSPADEEITDAAPALSGGMLDRLKEDADREQTDLADAEIPQWLEDLKTEEDPQETAVLWLQEFIGKGDEVDVQDEIKRYTDELDAGDNIPKWMEDLKNEEDPQTTAMLWLEKLSQERSAAPDKGQAVEQEDEHSDWLAELEREELQQSERIPAEQKKDFDDSDEGWLADLEIDQKLTEADDELPEWDDSARKQKPITEAEEPPWMKATSPLEGDIYTGDLDSEEEEIPAWLAGYTEDELTDEGEPSTEDAESEQPADRDGEPSAEDEYAWLSAEDVPKKVRQPLDLNKAAISQLETILGISYQVAKGIVLYREKQGPYRDMEDLLNVPEIVDEQTVEILKPEVFIGEVEPTEDEVKLEPVKEETLPAPVKQETAKEETVPAPVKQEKKERKEVSFTETLQNARSLLEDTQLQDAVEQYEKLIEKKEHLDEVIEDLKKASLEHPLDISIFKTLGDAHMQSNMLDEALEAYSKAEDLLT